MVVNCYFRDQPCFNDSEEEENENNDISMAKFCKT